MSKLETPISNGFYQAGGTLKAEVPSYIVRRADQELDDAILAGEFCYILTPRQMGKSSLMTQAAARLRREGHHVAVVDLSSVGGEKKSITADEWYYSLCHRLIKELKLTFRLSDWWQEQALLSPLQRLMNFFEEGVLSYLEGRVFVFVDEIDTTINLFQCPRQRRPIQPFNLRSIGCRQPVRLDSRSNPHAVQYRKTHRIDRL